MTILATVTATTTDNNIETTQQQRQPPQPKLSRATQKPHVRKNRRQSSLDRRRARYARLDAHPNQTLKAPHSVLVF